jgi:hypothetical protein
MPRRTRPGSLPPVNPRTIRWQACVTVPLLLLVTFIASPRVTGWLAGAALLAWLALNVGYAHSLQDRGRPPRRRHGDRWVARYVAFAFGIPLLVAVATHLADYEPHVRLWDFSVAETSALFIDGGVLFTLVTVSSLIDWYYVRPRIDGVVCEPPCRSSGSDRWKQPTRWWFLHRGLAALAYMGFAIVIALVVVLMLAREHKTAQAVVGGVGGLAGLLLIFADTYRKQIPAVSRFVLSSAHCLGDVLSYRLEGEKQRGFVLHVAMPVTKLVPLDADTGLPTGVPFVEIENADMAKLKFRATHPIACAKSCAKLNPQCVVGLPREDCARRYLIV